MESKKNIFVETVQKTVLPALLRDHAADVRALEEYCFDAAQNRFLEEQILLAPDGSEWQKNLRSLRADLLPFADAPLLRGQVYIGRTLFMVMIDPETKTVVHWQEYQFHVADDDAEQVEPCRESDESCVPP